MPISAFMLYFCPDITKTVYAMSNEINALIEVIVASGKEQGMNKGDIAVRAGMQNNKFGRIINSDPVFPR